MPGGDPCVLGDMQQSMVWTLVAHSGDLMLSSGWGVPGSWGLGEHQRWYVALEPPLQHYTRAPDSEIPPEMRLREGRP